MSDCRYVGMSALLVRDARILLYCCGHVSRAFMVDEVQGQLQLSIGKCHPVYLSVGLPGMLPACPLVLVNRYPP